MTTYKPVLCTDDVTRCQHCQCTEQHHEGGECPPEQRVVFRRFTDDIGGVIAFFPDMKEGRFIQSYMHIGQHGLAQYPNDLTVRADVFDDDVSALHRELRDIGYNLRIVSRVMP